MSVTLRTRIMDAFAPIDVRDGLLVPTPILYPSNGNVIVQVVGGSRSCTVSDRGDALRNARAHGVEIPNIDGWLGHIVRGSFLHAARGVITSGELGLDDVVAGIALVARASSAAVAYAIEHYKPVGRSIQERAYDDLLLRFGPASVNRKAAATGASHRHYTFDFSIASARNKPLLLDTVTPHANSVNAKAIAHIDLSALGERSPPHAIIYDDTIDWDAADINLLQSAGQLLPITSLRQELGRYELLH